jgi:hypothetical protein
MSRGITLDRRAPAPILKLTPAEVVASDLVRIETSGWPLKTALRFSIGEENLKVARLITGRQSRGGIYPGEDGRILLDAVTHGREPGKYTVFAITADGETKVSAVLVIKKRLPISPEIPREQIDKPAWRNLAFFEPRFGHLGYVPEGARKAQIEDVRNLRAKYQRPVESNIDIFLSRPLPDICNWTPMGPAPEVQNAKGLFPAHSGRIRSIAISPDGDLDTRTVFIGTASGGIWRSRNSGDTWEPVSDYEESPAIGALAIDPFDTNRILAGTGEYSRGAGTGYYGRGLLRSTDNGDTWSLLASDTFDKDEITRIVFNPQTVDHVLLSSDSGIFESRDGGDSWANLYTGSVTDLSLRDFPNGDLELIFGTFGAGVRGLEFIGGTWGGETVLDHPGEHGRVALSRMKNYPRYLWVVYATLNGSTILSIKRTTDSGSNWQDLPKPAGEIWQTNYNLYIQAHPSDIETAYLGVVHIWRTDPGSFDPTGFDPDNAPTGSSNYWRSIRHGGGINLHPDHHAFAFDPADSNQIFDCNDGGVYRSPDGGDTWLHLNHQIAGIQCYSAANHPFYEAIAVVGTQDNGGMFYTGTPAWLTRWNTQGTVNAMGGDVVFVVIDPVNPMRMYHGYYGNEFQNLRRSDNSGQTWTSFGLFSAVLQRHIWLVPFVLDTAGICYMGGERVYRSVDGIETWSPVSDEVSGEISAMSLHPGDTNILFMGTTTGHVYMVRRTGPSWDLTDMETIDLTHAGLPPGRWISSVQADSNDNLWITFSSLLFTEATGEFTSDHVYFAPPGATTWENRSAGLAQANPINR